MKSSLVMFLMMAIVGFFASTSFGQTIVKPKNLAEFEGIIISPEIACAQKRSISLTISEEIKKELFERLGGEKNPQNNNILNKAKKRLELMNFVFAYEGNHEWNEDDPRTLLVTMILWQEYMNPKCFDDTTDGLSSEEWLRGAVWAMEQKSKIIGGQ